ncbi:MAG: hypothetical protein ABSD21_07700 [Rhizomicrobium sp.]|jgi:hypothetical protein
MKYKFGLLVCFIVTPAFAQSLCTADETVVFTCQAKAKVVSACASKDVSPHGGYLQFRIGQGNATEISYPASRTRTANVVTFGYAGMDMGPPGHYVMLVDGPDTYGIITTDDRGPQYGGEESAFVRQRDGKTVDSLVCDQLTSPTDAGLDLLDKAGFKNVDSDALNLP